MLTRRHIRVKVLQSIYAYNQTENKDLEKQEKFLLYNMEQMQDLYLLMIQLFIALRDQAENYLLISQKKHLATDLEKKPSKLFIDNKVISLLNSNEIFTDIIKKKKLNYWENDSEYIAIIFNELKEKEWYLNFLNKKESTFSEDKEFIIKIFKDIIAPNEKLYEFIYNMGSFGNLILIGNSLYNVKRVIANLPQAYMYGPSHASHISLVIASIKDDTCCVLSKETIIDKFLEKPSGTQTQTMIDCWVGFSTLMDLVSDDRARKLLGRTISGVSGAKTEPFFIFIKSILLYSRDYGRLRANYFLNRVVSLRYYYGVNIFERMAIMVVTMIFKIPFLHKFFIYLIKRK